jgi:protein-S-isoprenylcysteine O-methyltransferase Ste14
MLIARIGGGQVMQGLVVHGGTAGPPAYWHLEAFAVICAAGNLPVLVYLLTHPALLRRRLRGGPLAEPESRQKIIVTLVLLCVLASFAVSTLDSVRGWSHVPVPIVLVGDLLLVAGLVVLNLVFRANPYAAATVTVEPGQTVSSSGPYARVRHPMYSAGLLLFLGTPLSLGSWWGLVLYPPIVVGIIWRLLDEERYLSTHLPRYREYCAKVTCRLIPSIW